MKLGTCDACSRIVLIRLLVQMKTQHGEGAFCPFCRSTNPEDALDECTDALEEEWNAERGQR